MTTNAGVWIDHHKAVILLMTNKGEASPNHSRRQQGCSIRRRHAQERVHANDFVAEDKLKRKEDATSINTTTRSLPACNLPTRSGFSGRVKAKSELKKRIESKKLRGKIARVETVDKMTDHEIANHVRQLFSAGSQ